MAIVAGQTIRLEVVKTALRNVCFGSMLLKKGS
jgi:hypothetical protein